MIENSGIRSLLPPVQKDQSPDERRKEAAERALKEAAERRKLSQLKTATESAETGGRNGPDPVRYGDWEKGGIASDF